MKTILMAGLLGILGTGSFAHATPLKPSQAMTCEEAVAVYAKYRRIYTIANGKDLVPIYGSLPRAQWRDLRCKPKQTRINLPVRTKDSNYCVIGVYCGSR